MNNESIKKDVSDVMDHIADIGKKPTHLNVRYVPRETLHYLKMMAAIERTSVKRLVLGLIEKRIYELERQGYLIRKRP